MFINQLSVRSLIVSLVVIGSLLTCLVVGSSLIFQLKKTQEFEEVLFQDIEQQEKIRHLQSGFQQQVQEWKNTLLRGKNAEDRQKYWTRFIQWKEIILERSEELINASPNHKIREHVKEFHLRYEELIKKYKEAYNIFKTNEFDFSTADTAVRGIDRGVVQQLNHVIDLIGKDYKAHTESITQETGNLFYQIVIGFFIFQFILCLISFYIVQIKLVKPTKYLLNYLEHLEQKDFSQPIKLATNDEFGRIAHGIERTRESLVLMAIELHQASDMLSYATGTMSTVTSVIAEDTGNVKRKIDNTSNATQDMLSSACNASNNTEEVARISLQADQQVRKSLDIMSQTLNEMNSLTQAMEQSMEMMNELKRNTEAIGGVIDVITGIADQTNLLALNAAIEAARAGEQGRGFAVVADEVRELAQRTQDSTLEIKRIIEVAQCSADKSVEAMEDGVLQTQKTSQFTSEVGELMHEICAQVGNIRGMSEEVYNIVDGQKLVLHNINQSVSDVHRHALSTAEQSKSVASTTSELAKIVSHMEDVVSSYKIENEQTSESRSSIDLF